MKTRALVMTCLIMVLFAVSLMAAEIHEAAKLGNMDGIKTILSRDKTQLNAGDNLSYTPLHWALIRAQWGTADYLIEQGADVMAVGIDSGTTLHCAANHDNPGMIERLIAKGVNPNGKNIWGNTPLALTTQRGCSQSVRALIAQGADIMAVTAEGWTPLHLAYRSGQKEVQATLIELGADEKALDNEGKRPVDLSFTRPLARPIPHERYNEYIGEYEMGDGFRVKVFMDGEKLVLEDYAQDEIYPIAPDIFYDRIEPWRIRFYRNPIGIVDKIILDFQTLTVIGRKVFADQTLKPALKIGVALKSLDKSETPDEILKHLIFDLKVNSYVQQVTRVGSGSVSEKAGVTVGDIILEFNNQPLREPNDLQRLLADLSLGDNVLVKVFRQNQVHYLTMKME